MKTNLSFICVVFVVFRFAPVASVAQLAESRFDASADGWYATGDPLTTIPAWYSGIGNPSGCIETADSNAGCGVKLNAPHAFLGHITPVSKQMTLYPAAA